MTVLETIAQQRTNEVVYSAISVTIEKIAAEAAREILRDPTFRQELKTVAQRSVRRAFRDLHANSRPRRKARRR